ncbi:hypothetical protein CCYA_CCYA07G2178 [Cyanidiococcus yangmingshanensis]|nr:hypothetical protein CCYA_CCYA07G2178 [Cyanidiococcus yangmingshanensis]
MPKASETTARRDPSSPTTTVSTTKQNELETERVRERPNAGRKRNRIPTADENWRALQQQLQQAQKSFRPKLGPDRVVLNERSKVADSGRDERVALEPAAGSPPLPHVTRQVSLKTRIRSQIETHGSLQSLVPNIDDAMIKKQSEMAGLERGLVGANSKPGTCLKPRRPGPSGLYPETRLEPLGSIIALDGEFVGVGSDGNHDALARISVVDYDESVLYDRYVRVEERVIDFRTPYSGIEPHHLRDPQAVSFLEAQQVVARLAQGRILVGHELRKDLQVLLLSHPHWLVRDTARYRPLRLELGEAGGRTPSLRRLAEKLLGQVIQQGTAKGPGHDSVEDATTALRLYKLVSKDWERDAKQRDLYGKQRAARYRRKIAAKHRDEPSLKQSTRHQQLRRKQHPSRVPETGVS